MLSNPFALCVLCGRQSRGFIVQFNPAEHLRAAKTASEIRAIRGEFQQYHCCSMQCQDATLKLVISQRGNMAQETITAMEQQAIKDARSQLWEAAQAIGAADMVQQQPAQNIDYLIYTIWCGLRASMQRQSAAGEIPF